MVCVPLACGHQETMCGSEVVGMVWTVEDEELKARAKLRAALQLDLGSIAGGEEICEFW